MLVAAAFLTAFYMFRVVFIAFLGAPAAEAGSAGHGSEFVQKLIAARLAADVMGVPTLVVARTDANSAGLLLSDIDPRDHAFLSGGRTSEGFFYFRGGIEYFAKRRCFLGRVRWGSRTAASASGTP